MKKLISIILATLIICPLLTACGGKGMGMGKVEQTNKELTIRVYEDYYGKFMDPAIQVFSIKYPDVKLNVEKITSEQMNYDEFIKKTNFDIMGGKGPDIIHMDVDLLANSDIYKMMCSGVFADLNDYFKKDSDFHIGDFNETVLNAGVFDGKRYVVPLYYSIPTLLSSETMIKESGFNIENCKDYFGFANEMGKYISSIKNKDDAPRIFKEPKIMKNYSNYMRVNMLDYKNKKVNIDTPEFKKASESYKLLYLQNLTQNSDKYNWYNGCVDLKQKKIIFDNGHEAKNGSTSASFARFFNNSQGVLSFDKPVALPIRNINGGIQAEINECMAVRNNSSNKQNAYNFIKIMISPLMIDRQFDLNNPILNSKLASSFSEYITFNDLLTVPDGITLQGLPQEYCDVYMKITGSITGTYFRNPWTNKLYEIMEPFYKGEKSYEECIKNAKDQMEIYITE